MNKVTKQRDTRSASVLVLTLIVVAMLTLGAAAFFERMFAEHHASRAHGEQLQASQFAESGVEYIKTLITQDPNVLSQSGGLYGNESLFKGVLVSDDPLADSRGRFTILAPDLTTDGYYGSMRYGLENESSRLNLNMVLLADSSAKGTSKKILMGLPGMTDAIADAILDWIDTDEEPRENGAERDYYASLNPPYAPRNGPLGSIEELLLVKGVTPALLFGADLNRNGEINGTEQKLTSIDNTDNSTGQLNRGWAAYLTVDSAEANIRPDGTPKIDVNMDNLEDLHKKLIEVFTATEADFIVAYRQGGAYTGEGAAQQISSVQVDLKQKGNVRLNSILDLIGVRTRIAKPSQSSGSSDGKRTDTRTDSGKNNNGKSGDKSGGGQQQGSQSGGESGGSNDKNSRVIIEAAFPNDKSSMQTYLPKLMDNLAVNAAPSIPGRLNINQAPRALLLGVPGMTSDMVDQIIAKRDVTMGPQHPEQKYETWLLANDIVDLATMKKLIPLITGGGSVYRAQIVGGFFSDSQAPIHRLEVVIDGTTSAPIVRRRWDLPDLGRGYKPEILGAEADDTK
jgi:hypothetical protein